MAASINRATARSKRFQDDHSRRRLDRSTSSQSCGRRCHSHRAHSSLHCAFPPPALRRYFMSQIPRNWIYGTNGSHWTNFFKNASVSMRAAYESSGRPADTINRHVLYVQVDRVIGAPFYGQFPALKYRRTVRLRVCAYACLRLMLLCVSLPIVSAAWLLVTVSSRAGGRRNRVPAGQHRGEQVPDC